MIGGNGRACKRQRRRWPVGPRSSVSRGGDREGSGGDALELEQAQLAPQAAAVAAEAATGGDHAVAGDDDGEAVGAVGATDGARRAGRAELAGELRVGARLPV